MSKLRASVGGRVGGEVGRRELVLLLAALGLGVALRLAYVLSTHDHTLAGGEPE